MGQKREMVAPSGQMLKRLDQRLWPPVSSSLIDNSSAEAALIHEPRRPTVCGLWREIYYFSAWPTSSQD